MTLLELGTPSAPSCHTLIQVSRLAETNSDCGVNVERSDDVVWPRREIGILEIAG